jgi:hypothetical protein
LFCGPKARKKLGRKPYLTGISGLNLLPCKQQVPGSSPGVSFIRTDPARASLTKP